MKFIDAAPQMKHGELFKTPEGVSDIGAIHRGAIAGIWFEWIGSGEPVAVTIGTLEIEGEIIRAEPEVLTAEMSWAERMYPQSSTPGIDTAYYSGFDDGDKNGQIKEYKRLKPLTDAAQEHIKYYCKPSERTKETASILAAELKNLTPPWEPEKETCKFKQPDQKCFINDMVHHSTCPYSEVTFKDCKAFEAK